MMMYLLNALLATLIAYSFYVSRDGVLRKILICLFSTFALYQFLYFFSYFTARIEHGSWYSYWIKFPFMLCMFALVIYMYKNKIINFYNKWKQYLQKFLSNIR